MAKALINQEQNMATAVDCIMKMDWANLILLNAQISEHMFNAAQAAQIKAKKHEQS